MLDNTFCGVYDSRVNKKEITIGRGDSAHCYQFFSTTFKHLKKPPLGEALGVIWGYYFSPSLNYGKIVKIFFYIDVGVGGRRLSHGHAQRI